MIKFSPEIAAAALAIAITVLALGFAAIANH